MHQLGELVARCRAAVREIQNDPGNYFYWALSESQIREPCPSRSRAFPTAFPSDRNTLPDEGRAATGGATAFHPVFFSLFLSLKLQLACFIIHVPFYFIFCWLFPHIQIAAYKIVRFPVEISH